MGLQAQSTDCLVLLAGAMVSPIAQSNQTCTSSAARDPTLNRGVCIDSIRQVGTDEYAQVTNEWWLGEMISFLIRTTRSSACVGTSPVSWLGLRGAERHGLERHLVVLHEICKCRERQI